VVIWTDERLFENEAARDVDRLALLRGAAERRHVLNVSASPGTLSDKSASKPFKAWHESLGSDLRVEVEILLERVHLIPPSVLSYGNEWMLVSDHPQRDAHPGCWLTLEQAVRAVSHPLYLLVENIINDAEFLRMALPPEWSRRLEDWERRGQIRYEHGGGHSIEGIVRKYTDDEYCRQAFGLPAEVWIALHFVLCDRDSSERQGRGRTARDVLEACQVAGMKDRRFHCLERRAQENYLPEEAALAILDRDKMSEVDKLSHRQDVEKHYAKPDRHSAKPPRRLKNRFSDDIHWSSKWFEKDGAWPELTKLAERIAAAM
jgi:hypothetical protein